MEYDKLTATEAAMLRDYAKNFWLIPPPLKRGDRVRIREGYEGAGTVLYYEAKSNDTEGEVLVAKAAAPMETCRILAAAIEPYPYTREERIERAIEDYSRELAREFGKTGKLDDYDKAILFAILDAGV